MSSMDFSTLSLRGIFIILQVSRDGNIKLNEKGDIDGPGTIVGVGNVNFQAVENLAKEKMSTFGILDWTSYITSNRRNTKQSF
jgi:hypothetical protein